MAEDREIEIDRLGSQGEGVGHMEGQPAYIPGTLPGERVRLGDDWTDHQPAAALVRSSGDRVTPLCRHFGVCGGCQLQHLASTAYLDWKRQLVLEAFASRGLHVAPKPVVAVGPHTRRRAVLASRRETGRVVLGFHGARSHQIIPIDECPVLVPDIERALDRLSVLLEPVVSQPRELRATVTAASNGLDVALTSGGKVAAAAVSALTSEATKSGVIRVTLDGAPVFLSAHPTMALGSAKLVLPPGAFIQASADAEAALVAVITDATAKSKRVADLFCGIGTFTFHLARRARVLAIDSDAASIAALQTAARATAGLKPIEARRRDLFGDPLSPRELDAFDTVVFDPPRAGAATQAAALARSKVRTVAAVSCNPATLARDVRLLVDGGYKLESVTPVDQFVFSAHVEAIAILRR